MEPLRCLVTGATGYIGGRLVPHLLAQGYTVRCMTRSADRLRDASWRQQVEVVVADATDPAATRSALLGVNVAYYLIHSIGAGPAFEAKDRAAARNFASAAAEAGVRRIVYLGGLVPPEQRLSPHLRSRAEVGQILLDGPVPTAVLQAAVILGSGSASFEMLRYLTERLPVMVTPRWVRTRIQPIAVRDVLHYLVGCATLADGVNRRFDIGGPDVLTYEEMMRGYAAVAGLRRRIIVPVPVLTPGLSSHWVNVVTPVPRAVARPLVASLRNEVVCRERDIARYVPDPPHGPTPFRRALELALQRIREAGVTTRWSSAEWPGAPSDPLPTDPAWAGGSLYVDRRESPVDDHCRRSVAGDRRHRRRERLVQLSAGLGRPGVGRPAGRRCGAEPRTPRSAQHRRRRGPGFLAGGGAGTARAAATARRDEATRPGMAGAGHPAPS